MAGNRQGKVGSGHDNKLICFKNIVFREKKGTELFLKDQKQEKRQNRRTSASTQTAGTRCFFYPSSVAAAGYAGR